jgi:ADP-dependent NAD(P)H-hydrate dehydratase / NAD(P)H-hydrate epimerase
MKILTAAQMREADRLTTERFGISSMQLMENAGAGVVEYLRHVVPDLAQRRVVVLCGKGNNGGDGFVVARYLHQLSVKVSVMLFAPEDAVRGEASTNLRALRRDGVEVLEVSDDSQFFSAREELFAADIIVDALLGTGLSGPVQGLLARAIDDVNRHKSAARVIAVDTPSGLPSDASAAAGPVIRADWTVTFTAPKIGQLLSPDSDCCGNLVVHSIGTPRELLDELTASDSARLNWIEPTEFRGISLRRKADSNKGNYGHALIVAGARGKAGAAGLAGWGALRAGAGLVTVGTPSDALPIVASYLPELMTAPMAQTDAGTVSLLNFDYNRFAELCAGKSVLAMGPGLGMHPETQQFVRSVVKNTELPIILDADGLNALAVASEPIERRGPALALTPHPGEMSRLLGCSIAEVQKDRVSAAHRAAAKYNAFVVLKGFHTILATPDGRTFINSTGNPGMATAGTGDVLTGILAGLTAQFGIENWERVIALGVYLHGLAGDLAASKFGEIPMTASDLIASIPDAFAQLLRDWDAVRDA